MEDSQKATEQQNEALIEEMLRDAQKTELPSELKDNPVVHKGDAELPAPMVVKEVSSAGYYWVYDTKTGERIPVLYYMLKDILKRKHDDGSLRFTVHNPGIRPKKGTTKCLLHPDSPNRKHYDELGFRVCTKSNLINDYQCRQHMIRKHPAEWAAIEEERKEAERQEDRALQRLLMANQLEKAEQTLGITPEMPPDELGSKSEGVSPVTQEVASEKFVCKNCGKEFAYKKTWRNHEKQCKK